MPKAQVAQLVEQRIENPCVAGSIPALGTIFIKFLDLGDFLTGTIRVPLTFDPVRFFSARLQRQTLDSGQNSGWVAEVL